MSDPFRQLRADPTEACKLGGEGKPGMRGHKDNLQDVMVTHTSSLEMCTG
jgi:hypothetical protein